MAEKTIVATDLNAMMNRKNGRNIKRSLRRKNILKQKPLQQSLQQEVSSPGSTHCADSAQTPATLISPSITEKKTSSQGKVDSRKSRKSEDCEIVTCDGDTKKINGGDCGVTTTADFEKPPSTRSDCGLLTSESKKDRNPSNFQNFRYQKNWRRNSPKNEDHEKNQEQVTKPELTPAIRNSIYVQHPEVDVNAEFSVTPKEKRNKKKKKKIATKLHLKHEQESVEQVQQQSERQGEQSVPMTSASEPSNVAGNQAMLPTHSSYPTSLTLQNIVSFQRNKLGKKARSNKAIKQFEMAPVDTSLGSSATEESLVTPYQVAGEASNDQEGSVKKDLLMRNEKSSKRDKKSKKGKKKRIQKDLLPSLNLRKSEVTSAAAVSSPEPQESESRLKEENAINTSCDHSNKNKSQAEMKGLSPITIGSSVLLEPMPPSNCELEAPKLCELSPQSTEATASLSETPQSPIHRVFTNAAGAAILRTISCNANATSCSSSVSSNMPLTGFSVSPSQLESGIAPMPQPHYVVPGKIFTQSSEYGNVRTYPFSGEVNERLQPYPYSNAGWMFMPVFPEGCYPPPPVLHPYGKMRYEAPSPSIFQQQHYYPQDMNCPSDTSSGGIRYSSNFGPDYWGVFYSNRMGPPLSDAQNNCHYLNVEAPEFNPTKFHLQ